MSESPLRLAARTVVAGHVKCPCGKWRIVASTLREDDPHIDIHLPPCNCGRRRNPEARAA